MGLPSSEMPFVGANIKTQRQLEFQPISWDELFSVPDSIKANDAIMYCPIVPFSSAKTKQLEAVRKQTAGHKEFNKAWNVKAKHAILSKNSFEAKYCLTEALNHKGIADKLETKMITLMSKIQGSTLDLVSQ